MNVLVNAILQKIISYKDIPILFNSQYRGNHKLVFTNGCFDMLHRGHIHLLISAKNLGDNLIIGLNSDDSIRRLKGKTRPIIDEQTRSIILASLLFVDFVILFNEDTPFELIQLVKPDILIKGGDYRIEDIVGYDIVTATGGEVRTIPFLEGFSSSSLINKLKEKKVK